MWQGLTCMAGADVHGRGHAWWGGVLGRGHASQGGHVWQGGHPWQGGMHGVLIFLPPTKFAKVMFLHLSVSHSVHRGVCVAGVDVHGRGACMVGAFMVGGSAWQGHASQGGMCGRGACITGRHAWQGASMAGGHA